MKYYKLIYLFFILINCCKGQSKDSLPEIKLIGPPLCDSFQIKKLSIKVNKLHSDNSLNIDSILTILTLNSFKNCDEINSILPKVSKLYDERVILYFIKNIDYYQRNNRSLRSWDYMSYPFMYAILQDSMTVSIYNNYLIQSDILCNCNFNNESLKLFSILIKYQRIEYNIENILLKYKSDKLQNCKYENLKKIFLQ